MYRRRGRKASKPRRRVYRKRNVRKNLAYKPKWFSETFKASHLLINQDGAGYTGGQVYSAAIDSIPAPQISAYKTLYRNYRIRKLEWIIIPRWGQAEPNQAELLVGQSFAADENVILHFRKTWQGNLTVATSEVDMLQNNGVKSVLMNGHKPLKITMRNPITEEFIETNVGGTTQLMVPVKNRWCSFDDAVYPQHGGLMTYTTSASTGLLQSQGSRVAEVYCKVFFEVKDPR